MMKKWVCVLAVVASLGCVAAASDDRIVCTGYGEGIGGDIVVTVEATEDAILSITVEENNETPGIGSEVIDTFPEQIVESQSLELDAIAGATVTSEGLINAVIDALESEGIDVWQFLGEMETETEF